MMSFHKYCMFWLYGIGLVFVNVSAKGYKSHYAEDSSGYACEDEVVDYNLPVPIATQPARLRQAKPSYGYCEVIEEPVTEKYYVKYSPPKKYYPTTPYKKEISRFYQVLQPPERYYEQNQSPAVPPPQPQSQVPPPALSQSTSSGKANDKQPAIQIYVV